MPSTLGHALTSFAIGAGVLPREAPRRVWVLGALCATLPDLDAVGRPFGLSDPLFLGGHRGLTHSISFALALGLVIAACMNHGLPWKGLRGRVAGYLVLATASHGLLDTFTAYGNGVALLAPFSAQRFVASWRPLDGFTEIVGIWFPAALVFYLLRWWRRHVKDEEAS